MANLLRQARQRALQYWVEDGIPDLYTGLLFLVFAGLRLLAQWAEAQRQATWMVVGFFGSLVVILVGSLAGRYVIDALKQRVTYPRTGYVAYTPPSKAERRKQIAVTALLALVLVGLVLLRPQAPLTLRLVVLHLVFALLVFAIALQLHSPRYFLYAFVVPLLAAGYLLGWPHWSPTLQRLMTYGEITFLVLGMVMTLGGVWTLHRYLKAHPDLEEAEA